MAHFADTGDADPATGQARRTPGDLCRGAHALEDAESGEDGRVTGASVCRRPTGDEPRLARDHVHVLDVSADVAGGVVAPAQRLDEATVGPQQQLGLVLGGIPDDDGLAAAEIESGT